MARRLSGPGRHRRPRAGAAHAARAGAGGARTADWLAARPEHAVREHRGGTGPARVPRRLGPRGARGLHGALERAGHGGASAADLCESCFNHFFRAREGVGEGQHRGDLVFFQPHSAPGVYARAFLEGRLSEKDLMHYRQELTAPAAGAQGLSSYPHPWLMPDFWQFPTGSMGIRPTSSLYHPRSLRHLTHRNLLDCSQRKVWGVFGDGEMDEPESMSALTLAAREGLDNLVWVVNCNLQRLDGPVRGNGRIIDELERLFAGAGWNVVKLVWGSDWDGLFARDLTGALVRTLEGTVDGQMQTFAAKD